MTCVQELTRHFVGNSNQKTRCKAESILEESIDVCDILSLIESDLYLKYVDFKLGSLPSALTAMWPRHLLFHLCH